MKDRDPDLVRQLLRMRADVDDLMAAVGTLRAKPVVQPSEFGAAFDTAFAAAFPAEFAWTTFTPTLTQSGAVTKTSNCAYMQLGALVIATIDLGVTGSGTGNNEIRIGLPVNTAWTNSQVFGLGLVGQGLSVYQGQAATQAAGTFALWQQSVTAIGVNPNIALANGNVIRALLMYRSA